MAVSLAVQRAVVLAVAAALVLLVSTPPMAPTEPTRAPGTNDSDASASSSNVIQIIVASRPTAAPDASPSPAADGNATSEDVASSLAPPPANSEPRQDPRGPAVRGREKNRTAGRVIGPGPEMPLPIDPNESVDLDALSRRLWKKRDAKTVNLSLALRSVLSADILRPRPEHVLGCVADCDALPPTTFEESELWGSADVADSGENTTSVSGAVATEPPANAGPTAVSPTDAATSPVPRRRFAPSVPRWWTPASHPRWPRRSALIARRENSTRVTARLWLPVRETEAPTTNAPESSANVQVSATPEAARASPEPSSTPSVPVAVCLTGLFQSNGSPQLAWERTQRAMRTSRAAGTDWRLVVSTWDFVGDRTVSGAEKAKRRAKRSWFAPDQGHPAPDMANKVLAPLYGDALEAVALSRHTDVARTRCTYTACVYASVRMNCAVAVAGLAPGYPAWTFVARLDYAVDFPLTVSLRVPVGVVEHPWADGHYFAPTNAYLPDERSEYPNATVIEEHERRPIVAYVRSGSCVSLYTKQALLPAVALRQGEVLVNAAVSKFNTVKKARFRIPYSVKWMSDFAMFGQTAHVLAALEGVCAEVEDGAPSRIAEEVVAKGVKAAGLTGLPMHLGLAPVFPQRMRNGTLFATAPALDADGRATDSGQPICEGFYPIVMRDYCLPGFNASAANSTAVWRPKLFTKHLGKAAHCKPKPNPRDRSYFAGRR